VICLKCGVDNLYGSPTCQGCQQILGMAPPHVKPNHVSQLQVALEQYAQGTLDRDSLIVVIQRFEERVSEFEANWGALMSVLFKDRLAGPLQERYRASMIEVDRALAHLSEALWNLQEFQQEGPDDLLLQAGCELMDFFRIACAGCALAMAELEQEELRKLDVGRAADFSA